MITLKKKTVYTIELSDDELNTIINGLRDVANHYEKDEFYWMYSALVECRAKDVS